MGDYMIIKSKGNFVCRIIFTFFTVFMTAFIFYNSMQNAVASGESSGRVMTFLNNCCVFFGITPFFTQEIVRTMAHLCEFGLLGVLSASAFLSWFGLKLKSTFFSLFYIVFVSFTDEIIQLFSDGRAFQFSDIGIDIAGFVLGAGVVFLFVYVISYVNRKLKKV